jgi:hypothetical protein
MVDIPDTKNPEVLQEHHSLYTDTDGQRKGLGSQKKFQKAGDLDLSFED